MSLLRRIAKVTRFHAAGSEMSREERARWHVAACEVHRAGLGSWLEARMKERAVATAVGAVCLGHCDAERFVTNLLRLRLSESIDP